MDLCDQGCRPAYGRAGDGDDEERLVPPFRFVGLEEEPRPGKPVRGGERYVDANGRTFNPLDVYR